MRIEDKKERNGLQRVYAQNWIVELPLNVKVGKQLVVTVLDDDIKTPEYSVVLNGRVFRTSPHASLVSWRIARQGATES